MSRGYYRPAENGYIEKTERRLRSFYRLYQEAKSLPIGTVLRMPHFDGLDGGKSKPVFYKYTLVGHYGRFARFKYRIRGTELYESFLYWNIAKAMKGEYEDEEGKQVSVCDPGIDDYGI